MRHAVIRRSTPILLMALVAGCLLPGSPPAQAAATLELYGTFHAMGIIVHITTSDDPDRDAVPSVAYRTSGDGPYTEGFPLSRVSDTRFVGSLFWLEAGTAYDVRITFTDPDGHPLNGVTVEATVSTRAAIAIPPPGHSHYVSPAGSGTACSLVAPCSLTEGLNQAQAGDHVVLREGVYHQGEMTLPRSGAAGTPIVIRGYPGEMAVLNGADPATFSWTAQGGGVYHTSVNVSAAHLVTSNGQRLYPYQSLADLQALHWSIPGFFANGTTVYVRLAGDVDPDTTTMQVSRYNHAFHVDG